MSDWIGKAAQLAVMIGAGLIWSPADAADRGMGARIARTYCAECHSLGAAPSPLADAPAFSSLYRRLPPGTTLEALLGKGMIASSHPIDDRTPPLHPRMPQIQLDDDQVENLIAFLRSVQTQVR